MRTIKFIIQKEFIQIFRTRTMLGIIFAMPLIQLLILGYAASFEIKNINLCVVDNDHSMESRALISKIPSSGYFNITSVKNSRKEAVEMLDRGISDLIIEIPNNFQKDIFKNGKSIVYISADAINGMKAGLAMAYLRQMIMGYNSDIIAKQGYINVSSGSQTIDIVPSFWFNPFLDYKAYMVPGILVVLVTVIGGFLTAMNITREKEVGTIEQLNVTPIKKYQFIIGKMAPFFIIGLLELAIGLTLAKIIYNIPINGSLITFFVFGAIYLLIVLAMGLLVSSYTETQQQAMFIAWFFMLIFILMSGLFTSIESMPDWAQKLTWLNPIAWFVKVVRMILITGSSLADLINSFLAMLFFAIFFNFLAIKTYKKTIS